MTGNLYRLALLCVKLSLGVTFSLAFGCASVMNGNVESVTILSQPVAANVTVFDENRRLIYTGTTPAQVQLAKGNGDYFGKKTYRVVVEKSGYGKLQYKLEPRVSLWYALGNVFTLGLGYFVLDPKGPMYRLSPRQIMADIKQTRFFGDNGAGNHYGEAGVHVSLKKP